MANDATLAPIAPAPEILPTVSKSLAEVLSLHQALIADARMTLQKAIRIGELLTGIKASLKHGDWLPWVEKNLPFSDQTGRNYIRLWEKRDDPKFKTVLNFRDAYRLLSGGGQLQVEKFTGDQESYTPAPVEPKTAKQLIHAAMKEIFDAGDLLEKKKPSAEDARRILKEVEKIKFLAKRLLDRPWEESFAELICILTKCEDHRWNLERGRNE